MEQVLLTNFLKSYFNLFKASIEDYKIVDKKLFGTVGWENELDKQDFVLNFDSDTSSLLSVKLLCEFISENNLINGDRIVVSEADLLTRLIKAGWGEDEAREALNFLFSFDVKMLDDGEETDSFFVHL